MTEYRVYVRNGDMRAIEALAAAHFKAAGIPQDDAGNVIEHELADEIQVIVEANDPNVAVDRVKQQLPEGDYRIERVELIGQD